MATRAAARHMIRRGSGPHTLPGLGGFKIALDALEGFRRQWACELGQHGIRVVTIKTGGVPESIDTSVAMRDEITTAIEQATLLKRAAQLSNVGSVAAFVASDQARTITASTVDIPCGALMDY
jgi:3-oxoacyl-[acyl-carrier protein] reductase